MDSEREKTAFRVSPRMANTRDSLNTGYFYAARQSPGFPFQQCAMLSAAALHSLMKRMVRLAAAESMTPKTWLELVEFLPTNVRLPEPSQAVERNQRP